ncbi:MAG: citrate lyase acyl carrier protein [Bacteroidetes bacterium]|nr:MAG: citrate lyase acyl carrier protein [Bacteroidota bacterium]PIE88408.1 MAG: citrate lyase acyl carrier protein [Bacteroidota bacterium]
MELIQNAQVGTFESSDIMILIEPKPKGEGREIELVSNVIMEYGDSIKEVIHEVLDQFEVSDVKIIATDKGALNPTIRARVETAVKRALKIQEGTL